MWETVADYVRSLDLDAWLVGGAVRDELLGKPVKDADFVVPNVGQKALRKALARHGGAEDLVVAGQRVGVRLHPRDRRARALAPAGIEFAPPRVERSTGPGRHAFEIVADPEISLEEDMRRRDFTVNAMAKSLATGELLDPLGGADDLRRGVLRTTGPTSFRDDPLLIVRGLRLVSQLDLDPDEETLTQMREWAPQVALVSGERIGGGLAADGLGELSKLLLGPHPAKALRLARDTGVLTVVIPEFGPVVGHEQGTDRQPFSTDEHVFRVIQEAAGAGEPLAVRLGALLHDLGKPLPAADSRPHQEVGAQIAARVLRRLRYPTRLSDRVTRLVRDHAFTLDGEVDDLRARRFLREHGLEHARDLIGHKRADLAAKRPEPWEPEALERLARAVEEQAGSAYRIDDLAVDGSDLIELGFEPGPALGAALRQLLDDVVDDPGLNESEILRRRARTLLA